MTKISDLSEVTSIADADYIPVVKASGGSYRNRKISGLNLATTTQGHNDRLSADVSAGATSIAMALVPAYVQVGMFVVIGAPAIRAEVREITAITETSMTIAALDTAHSESDPVFFTYNPILNVRWFGATGDGTTDDDVAIQACIDDLTDGWAIEFPSGDYKYTTVPTFTTLNNIQIVGTGTLKPSACGGLLIDDCEDVIVDGLRLQATQASNTYIGINLLPATGNDRHVVIKNCHLSGFKTGIEVSSSTYTAYNTRIHDNWIELVSPGIADSTGILVEEPDCKVYNNTIQRYVEGIALDGGSQTVTGNHIWAEAVDATPTSCIAIRRGGTTYGRGYIISNNYLDGCLSDAHLVINVQGSEDITVTGNHFRVSAAMTQCILFENGGTTWEIHSVTIIGNVVVNVAGSSVEFLGFSGVQTNESVDLHIHSNSMRTDVTKYSTRDDVRQVVSYGATVVPNPMLGRLIQITLTGNIVIDDITYALMGGIGNRLTFLFIQDATAGRTVTFHANFKNGWSDTGNTNGLRSTITFEWDGTNWNQVGGQSPYVATSYDWIDYSDDSTIVGWTTYTKQQIFYKEIPGTKIIKVMFRIEGESDSAVTSFTVPTANGAAIDVRSVYRGSDNAGAMNAWYVRLPTSSAVVSLYAGMGSTTWTTTGVKAVAGQFFYEIA